MTQLIRNNVKSLLSEVKSAHAGLMMQRALESFSNPNCAKEKIIKIVASISPSTLYDLAFNRWVSITQEQNRFQTLSAGITGRLFTGLSIGGTLETGVTTHHTYGMPMLAGSSVKGAVRSYAETIKIPKEYLQVLFGNGDHSNPDDEDNMDNRTKENISGALIWHDAWWVPVQNRKPFVAEVVTVHHQQYYSHQKDTADGTESPVPNQQLAVQGGFYFTIEGPEQWASFARDLLAKMLEEQGMGAKIASGYGGFESNNQDVLETVNDIIEMQKLDLSNPVEVLRLRIKKMDGENLKDNLKCDPYKFLADLNIQDDDLHMLENLKIFCNDFYPNLGIRTILNRLIEDAKGGMDAEETIRNMNEETLINSLCNNKNRNELCQVLSLDINEANIYQIKEWVLKYHEDKIKKWSTSNAKNTIKTFKFLKNQSS